MLQPPNPKEIDRKLRMQQPSMGVPKQGAAERRTNFDETYLPFDLEQVRREAARCIQCPGAPCIKACPLDNDIPLAMWQLEHGWVILAMRPLVARSARRRLLSCG